MGGKGVQQEASSVKVDQNRPGCVWSVLHILKYHRWKYVRKRIPYKRTKNQKPGDDSKSVEHNHGAAKGKVAEEKPSKSSGTKHSVKARLKALITDDIYRKKGKHHRTASVPHLDRHVQLVDEDPIAGIIFNEGRNDVGDKGLDKYHKQQTGNDHTVKEKFAKRTFVEQNLTKEEELKTDPASESKECLNALNIINLNKESLLKLLHTKSSRMVQHFHIQQGPDGKIVKSNLLPSPDPSGGEEFGLLKLKSMKETLPQAAEYRKDGSFKRSRSVMNEYADNSSPGSVHLVKNTGESQPVSSTSRFKVLKNKIKQVLEKSRHEKQRITMDAVLHKVPPGNKFSKETKKAVAEQLRNPVLSGESRCSVKSSEASKPQHIRRTTSLNESLDRYCQLYEATNKEVNNRGSERERPQSRTEASSPQPPQKHLARILSLPDLYYYSYQSEDSSEASSAAVDSSDSEKRRLNEDKGVGVCESKGQENLVEAIDKNSLTSSDQMGLTSAASDDVNAETGLHSDNSAILASEDGTSQHEHDIVGKRSLKPEELSSVSIPDLGFEEDTTTYTKELEPTQFPPKETDLLPNQQHDSSMDTAKMGEKSMDIQKVEIPSKKVYDIPRLRVEENNKAEFHFVRDVLELSGFSGTEALGLWHAEDQPLDPSMYEEVEGYLVLEPSCYQNEGENSYQLVLFDVINEVLMEIYERSSSYIPRRLSSVCHIRPLPVGQHVLEEAWEEIRWFLKFKPEPEQPVDCVVARDLAKNDGWMNLQSDSECVGLELESLIFDEILEEAIWDIGFEFEF